MRRNVRELVVRNKNACVRMGEGVVARSELCCCTNHKNYRHPTRGAVQEYPCQSPSQTKNWIVWFVESKLASHSNVTASTAAASGNLSSSESSGAVQTQNHTKTFRGGSKAICQTEAALRGDKHGLN